MLSAYIVPQLDENGHIIAIVAGELTIGGQWKP